MNSDAMTVSYPLPHGAAQALRSASLAALRAELLGLGLLMPGQGGTEGAEGAMAAAAAGGAAIWAEQAA